MGAGMFFVSCNKEGSDKAAILSMRFDFGEVVFDDAHGVARAPEGTDLKHLIPHVEVSKGATVYPPSGAITNFSEPVDYTVISENGQHTTYYTVEVRLPLVAFTVLDCCSRTPENPVAVPAAGATIRIWQHQNDGQNKMVDSLTTDDTGRALFYGLPGYDYCFVAIKGDACNILGGYIVAGIFTSEKDVETSPKQSQPSEVGDLKFMDVNCDLLVNEDDMYERQCLWAPATGPTRHLTVYIAKE